MKKLEHTKEFRAAMTSMTINDMFFTARLYALRIEQDDKMEHVAGTDGVRLTYNPARWAELPRRDAVYILAHEIMHCILFHSLRRGLRNPTIWNYAADFVVNGLLTDHGYGKPPNGGLYDVAYLNMTTEQVYDALIDKAKDQAEKSGGGDDDGDGTKLEEILRKIFGDFMKDVRDYDPATNNGKPAKEVEREGALETSKAAESAKAAGKMSKLMERFVSEISVAKQPWYSLLAPFMAAYNAREFNWQRPDFKRSMIYKALMPKMQSESMGKVVIGIDCSGSMDETQLSSIASHMSDILTEGRPSAVDIVCFDSKIVKTDHYTGPFYDFKLKMVGGGGTDFHPVVEYAEGLDDCNLLIVFTDMYGPMPEQSTKDTMWVTSTKDLTPSFGSKVEADFND